ncbi:helix-turn-helix domain-containing protein [Croceicoccus marinus]|uniref:Helix-turn-helix transcriptional regulator n=1 Tax=Croceicoccus marinus TaxID=450378 RepID=A0A7G6W144_9SPHN|nr:helix-turn-helix transcriptional regulator [Croceicoccus marinus]QNE07709.1 helix-turn-helix transcriptional regulator [Croceicoccus marinus]
MVDHWHSDIGRRLKIVRKVRRLKQETFARAIGTSQPSLAAYEKGRNKPSLAVIVAACRTYSVSADWILFGDEAWQAEEAA